MMTSGLVAALVMAATQPYPGPSLEVDRWPIADAAPTWALEVAEPDSGSVENLPRGARADFELPSAPFALGQDAREQIARFESEERAFLIANLAATAENLAVTAELRRQLARYRPPGPEPTRVTELSVSGPRNAPTVHVTLDQDAAIEVDLEFADGDSKPIRQRSQRLDFRHSLRFENLPIERELVVRVYPLDLGGHRTLDTYLKTSKAASAAERLPKMMLPGPNSIQISHLHSNAGSIQYAVQSVGETVATYKCRRLGDHPETISENKYQLRDEERSLIECKGAPGDVLTLVVEGPIAADSGMPAHVDLSRIDKEGYLVPDYPWYDPVTIANGQLSYTFSCDIRKAEAKVWFFDSSHGSPKEPIIAPTQLTYSGKNLQVSPLLGKAGTNLMQEKSTEAFVVVALDLCGHKRVIKQLITVERSKKGFKFAPVADSLAVLALFLGHPEVTAGIEALKAVVAVWKPEMVEVQAP